MKYLSLITKQNAASVYGSVSGIDVPNVTLNSDGITYTNNDECIIAYTFTWYDKFIELDEGIDNGWKYCLYDDPTDGKTKYILSDPIDKHIHLLADGESFVWLIKIPKTTFENSSYRFNVYQSLPTNLPYFYNPAYVNSYIPGINEGCYTWESNVEYCMEHAAELEIISYEPYSLLDGETEEEAVARRKQEVQAKFDALSYDERYTQAENWLKNNASNFYGACNTYAITPEDQELYCKICLQGVWRDRENKSNMSPNYRNSELVSCLNFMTSNITSIKVNNVSSYRNCSKLIFNDNIETLAGFNAGGSYFSYIHLPKHLKNVMGCCFSCSKGGGIADGHNEAHLFIEFGDELESITDSMFNNGEGIKISMKLPKSLKDIWASAFHWFNTDDQLIIPASVETIGIKSNYSSYLAFKPMFIQTGKAIEGEKNYIITKIPSVKFEGTTPPVFAKVSDSSTPLGYWQDFAYTYDENNVTITKNSYNLLQYTAPLIKASYPIYVPRGSKAAYMAALDLCEESRFIEYDPE